MHPFGFWFSFCLHFLIIWEILRCCHPVLTTKISKSYTCSVHKHFLYILSVYQMYHQQKVTQLGLGNFWKNISIPPFYVYFRQFSLAVLATIFDTNSQRHTTGRVQNILAITKKKWIKMSSIALIILVVCLFSNTKSCFLPSLKVSWGPDMPAKEHATIRVTIV